MKALDVFITALVLTCFAFLPLTAQADEDLDDLDVTMEVLDDETGLDDDIAEMAPTKAGFGSVPVSVTIAATTRAPHSSSGRPKTAATTARGIAPISTKTTTATATPTTETICSRACVFSSMVSRSISSSSSASACC